MCGYIPKDKLFYTPLNDIEWMVDHVIANSHHKRKMGIFGGEPTIHPQFREMLELLAEKDWKFTVYTNGRKVPNLTVPKNVKMRVDPKDKPERQFVQTWNAPKDYYKREDHEWYFTELAQKYCFIWNNCRTLLYDKKGYACVTFATIDILTGENHGWEMVEGKDVFERTFDEVVCQAKHYCYRCGHCMKRTQFQNIGDPTTISPTNLDMDVQKEKMELVQIQLPM